MYRSVTVSRKMEPTSPEPSSRDEDRIAWDRSDDNIPTTHQAAHSRSPESSEIADEHDSADVDVVEDKLQVFKRVHFPSKQFVCTFPRCYLVFDGRSKWERHEEEEHEPFPESWKCTLEDTSGLPCLTHAYTWKAMQRHMTDRHGIVKNGFLDELGRSMRLGRDGYNKFWCGFCRRVHVVPRDSLRGDLSYRKHHWNHFSEHIEAENRLLADWICFELDMPYATMTKLEKERQRKRWNELSSEDDMLVNMLDNRNFMRGSFAQA